MPCFPSTFIILVVRRLSYLLISRRFAIRPRGDRSDANDPFFRDFVSWIEGENRKVGQLYGWADVVVDWEFLARCGGCGPLHDDDQE